MCLHPTVNTAFFDIILFLITRDIPIRLIFFFFFVADELLLRAQEENNNWKVASADDEETEEKLSIMNEEKG
jgi:hypothetical protein